MNNESIFFVKLDTNNLKIKVNKEYRSYFAITFILILTLFEKFIIQLGVPRSIIYINDMINLFLFIGVIRKRAWKRFVPMLLAYAGIVLFGIIIALVNYKQWGGTPLFTLIEIRNVVRFPIFFIACASFLNETFVEKIFKILTYYFYINSLYIVYLYFTYHPVGTWMRGDLLNGFFGTSTGGNTYVNVLMLCVISYWLSKWAAHKCSLWKFLIPLCVSVTIAGLIELRAFFIEVAFLYIWYFISQRKSIKVLFKNVVIILLVVAVGRIALQYMYDEYPWFRGAMSITGIIKLVTSSSGYTNNGDLNRFTGVTTVAKNIFKGDLGDILFGIGLGNAAVYSLGRQFTDFSQRYSNLNYSWFSCIYVFIQCGVFGLISYLYTFFYLFFRGGKNKKYSLIAQIMAMMAVVLAFYGEALKTDAGYFVYFAIACGFIKYVDKEIKEDGRYKEN